MLEWPAPQGGGAAPCGAWWSLALALAFAVAGCGGTGTAHHPSPAAPGEPWLHVALAPAPSKSEDYCAWYGDARGGVLYFGQAAFWSSARAAGNDPLGDLAEPGPQLVGRFDLEHERLLTPLDVTAPGARSGVWDVHAHGNGRVYFTTLFEAMGAVDPTTGEVERFTALGLGLNEIAPAPEGNLVVTRYGAAGPGDPRQGSLVVITPDGELLAELPLEAPPGAQPAPKTPAWHSAGDAWWVTNDLIPDAAGPVTADALVLAPDGALRRRIVEPEVQFVTATPEGGLLRAEVDGGGLWLAGPAARDGRRLLDAGFARELDFAQDLKLGAAGEAVVTRWSGRVHVAAPRAGVRSTSLPALVDGGLYYTAVVHGQRLCATYCAGVRVVCTDAP